MAMTIQQVSERELSTKGIRCIAVPTLEWNGLKYVWLTSYAADMQVPAQERCQDLQANGRAALLVGHEGGNFTVWQGPAGSAQLLEPMPQEPALDGSQRAAGPTEATPQASQSKPETTPQPQTVTIKYRGRTIVKQLGPTDANQQQKGQRSYRGQTY